MINWPSRSKVGIPCLHSKTFVIFQMFMVQWIVPTFQLQDMQAHLVRTIIRKQWATIWFVKL